MLVAFCIRYPATHVSAFSCVLHLVPGNPTSKLGLMISASSTLDLFIEKCNASESVPWLCFVLENTRIALSQCLNAIYVPILISNIVNMLYCHIHRQVLASKTLYKSSDTHFFQHSTLVFGLMR